MFETVLHVVSTMETGVTLAKNEGDSTVPFASFRPVKVTVTAYWVPFACGDPEKVKIEEGPPAGTPAEGL